MDDDGFGAKLEVCEVAGVEVAEVEVAEVEVADVGAGTPVDAAAGRPGGVEDVVDAAVDDGPDDAIGAWDGPGPGASIRTR